VGVSWIDRKGRSVVRANWGRYVSSESTATATANSPLNTAVNSGFRLWNDTNGNFFPDCNLTSTAANGGAAGSAHRSAGEQRRERGIPRSCAVGGVRPSDIELLVGMQQKLTEFARR